MSATLATGGPGPMPLPIPRHRRRHRPLRIVGRMAAAVLGIAVAFWTLLPVYNILLIALSEDGDQFSGTVWPSNPSFEGFEVLWSGEYWHLEDFWHQFGNSVYIGAATMVLTVLIGSYQPA